MYIYGKQPVLELLRSDHAVIRLMVAKTLEPRTAHTLKNRAEAKKILFQEYQKNDLQRFCGSVVHQGIVAEIKAYAYVKEEILIKKISVESNPLVLILDQVQDVHNVGAIIRSCEIAGITALILPEKGSVRINETVAKTSAGAIFHCAIHQASDLHALLVKIAEMDLTIVAMVPHQELTIYEANLKKPLAVLVGSEGRGVRKNLLPYCSQKLSIQQYGRLDSLNVSVATALVLFEARRQRLSI